MKKISILMAIIMLVLSLSLVSCGKKDDQDPTTTTTSKKEEKFVLGDIEKSEVGKTVVDEDLGYTITVQEMVKNVPNDYGDSEHFFGVALKLRVERKSEMTLIGGLDFQLLVNGEKATQPFSSFSHYAEEKGWERLSTTMSNGEFKEGWLIFKVSASDAKLTFRYARPELPVTVIGGENYKIPAKNFDIEL